VQHLKLQKFKSSTITIKLTFFIATIDIVQNQKKKIYKNNTTNALGKPHTHRRNII
jgi:hypothetical protein